MTGPISLQKPVTMATIARLTGISPGAISSLLNHRDYGIRVSEATRLKVLQACREVGYVPKDLRALIRIYPERGDLALLWQPKATHFLYRGFGPRFLKGVRSVLADQNGQVTVSDVPDKEAGDVLPGMLRDGIVSRVITVGHIDSECRRAIADRDIQQIAVEADPNYPGVTAIFPDYQRAALMALEHLHQLGHRNIAVITSGCAGFELREKLLNAGVKEGARALKLTIDRTIASQPGWQFENGADIATRITGSPVRATAVFCYRDEVAAGIACSLLAAGRKIPQDLSIVGCGADEASRYLHPALTTVSVPAELIGIQAAEAILTLSDPAAPPQRIIMPVELSARGTTGRCVT